MKKKIPPICNHDWDDLCIFKTTDGKSYLQQRCRKCKNNRYIEISKIDQNGSEKEPKANV